MLSDTVVSRLLWHQTHAVVVMGCGHMTHCGPLVLFRVVDNHVSKEVTIVATCRASGVKIVQYCPALTGYHEPSIIQSQASN